MARLKTLGPRVPRLDTRTAPPAAKEADAELQSPAYRAWARGVKERAGFRCEIVENGARCEKSRANGDVMYADHVEERRDGGALLGEGRCTCASHHTRKTNAARAERLAAPLTDTPGG